MDKRRAKRESLDALTALNHVRDDIRALEWEALAEDGVRTLVAKEAVLEIVQDWIEYCLNPKQTVLAEARKRRP